MNQCKCSTCGQPQENNCNCVLEGYLHKILTKLTEIQIAIIQVRMHETETFDLSTPRKVPDKDGSVNSKLTGHRCPKCGDHMISNQTGHECGAMNCDYNAGYTYSLGEPGQIRTDD